MNLGKLFHVRYYISYKNIYSRIREYNFIKNSVQKMDYFLDALFRCHNYSESLSFRDHKHLNKLWLI